MSHIYIALPPHFQAPQNSRSLISSASNYWKISSISIFPPACDQRDVFMLQPFTSKAFAIRPLADVIADLTYLLYLYPNIPKEQAFGKYYTPMGGDQPSNGYVKPHLITHVPG